MSGPKEPAQLVLGELPARGAEAVGEAGDGAPARDADSVVLRCEFMTSNELKVQQLCE
jgi:hypothetical protein